MAGCGVLSARLTMKLWVLLLVRQTDTASALRKLTVPLRSSEVRREKDGLCGTYG